MYEKNIVEKLENWSTCMHTSFLQEASHALLLGLGTG